MGKGGARAKRTSNPIWSAELAYACGLMATDGNVSKDGRHIDLTSQDLDQLETFKRCVDVRCKISFKTSSFTGKKVTRIMFSDAVLHRWFISIGITPAKTHTIEAVNIPDEYFADFLRGELDGDGFSNAYWDTRWHSSVSLYIGFTSGSEKHLSWLQGKIQALTGMSGIIKPNNTCFTLEFSKAKAKPIYTFMYYSDDIPYLRRKKEKLDRQWLANDMAQQGIRPPNFVKNGSVLKIT